jgi:UDP-N-acetylmuramoyl-tripeptide--D-alanyl-D-alanine ligase
MSAVDKPAPAPRPQPASSGFWTLDRITEALERNGLTSTPRGASPLGRIWTDTRSIQPGDVFVALRGESFDAHDFITKAVDGGAAALVVDRADAAVGLEVPAFVVDDTLDALGALAGYRRNAWGKTVVGIVGTNGKTSTKELIRSALGTAFTVHATEGNLNNLVGVPLTIFALPDHADVAIIEMGTNQPGEVARLRDIARPDIVVVTSIAEEHLEGLGSVEGVMREELSACDGAELAIVPAAQPEVVAAARGRARATIAAGIDSGDLTADRWSISGEGIGTAVVEGIEVTPAARGLHNLRNAMLALAVARACGVTVEQAARGIASMRVPPMRVNIERIGQATLINDAYNSNPGSARAALDLLTHIGVGRQRVAVLGSMLEMGAEAPRLHREVLRAALELPIEMVVGTGDFAQAIEDSEADPDRALAIADVEGVWEAVRARVEPDAVILLKASRGMKLERLVPAITHWAQS